MTSDDFLSAFGHFVDAPNGFQKLRELILQLAVQGKLVEQDPDDEPAVSLLRKIKAEKQQLAIEQSIRASAETSSIDTSGYVLPDTWCVTSLGEIGYVKGGKRVPRGYQLLQTRTPYIYVRVTDMKAGTIRDHDLRYVSAQVHAEISRYTISKDDLYVTIAGTIGDVGEVPEQFDGANLTENAAKLIFRGIGKRFLLFVIQSQLVQRQFAQFVNQMAQPKLALRSIAATTIPLPPLAEQHRIVAKVDELMAMCDKLEAEHNARHSTHTRLIRAVHHPLTEASDAASTAIAWRRIRNHFANLYTTRESVQALRQTILQLAVQGKLVEQDPNDEPASVILEKVRKQKDQLEADKPRKRPRNADKETNTAISNPLPDGWCQTTFGSATINRDAERVPLSRENRSGRAGPYDYYGASGVIDHIDDYLFDKPLLLIGEDGANLVNRATPIAFLARGKYWVNNHAHVLDGPTEGYLAYLCLFINATDLTPYVTGTAQPKMNQAKMNSISVPLPPEEEQRRIVAKVDELMALCDQLDDAITVRDTTASQYAEAVVRQLSAA